MKTVADLKNAVSGLLTGTNLDNVTNLYGAFERSARMVVQKADLPETIGRFAVNVYDGVYDYLGPTTIFGGSIVDFRPQGNSRNGNDYVYKKPIEMFDRTKVQFKNGLETTFEWKKGTPIMRVAGSHAQAKILIDQMNDTTGWANSGDAGAIVADNSVFYEKPASLRFDCNGSGQSIITKTLLSAIDLSTYKDTGVQFLAIKTPSETDLTSIELRIGSDSSNYITLTRSQGFLGAWKTDDFYLVDFNLANATEVGTVDWTKINYVEVIINHTATLTNFYVGKLWISLPSPYTLLYQTSAIFMNPDTGELITEIIDDNTQIILNDSAFTLYEYESASNVAFQNGGSLSTGILATINQILHGVRARNGAIIQLGLYDQYRADNPSQELREVGSWYD